MYQLPNAPAKSVQLPITPANPPAKAPIHLPRVWCQQSLHSVPVSHYQDLPALQPSVWLSVSPSEIEYSVSSLPQNFPDHNQISFNFISPYSCVHCSLIFPDVGALKSHIQSTHCEIFFKCPICPMAFKSAPGTQSHVHTQHQGMKGGDPK